MYRIVSLYDREPKPHKTLPAVLAALYDGGLVIPQGTAERPYLVANFVETIDGVVDLLQQDSSWKISRETNFAGTPTG